MNIFCCGRGLRLMVVGLVLASSYFGISVGRESLAKADPGCQENGVLIIFARGSSEPIGYERATSFFRSVEEKLTGLRVSHVELGNIDGGDSDGDGRALDPGEYPAVDIWHWPDGGVNMDGYYASVNTGSAELRNYLAARTARCPTESVILGGYSQGAEVIGYALTAISDAARDHIAYVALFGDPRFNSEDWPGCILGTRSSWVRGDASCASVYSVPAGGILGKRSPYLPAEFRWRTGSWCDAMDGICTSVLPLAGGPLSGHTNASYTQRWMPAAAKEIGPRVRAFVSARASPGGSPSTQQFPAILPPSARDGSIIRSDENHLYALAGGRLFWFDKNDAAQRAAFEDQDRRLTGTDSYIPLHHDAVHALEVNRDWSGDLVPGANMPADNIFLREYGSNAQYVIKYAHPFPIASPEEVIALGGQDKAIMVPKSISDLGRSVPQWVQGDQVRFWNDPAVWYYSDRGYRVPSVPTRDCLSVRHGGRGVTLLPASARALFPDSGQNASCDFGHGQWLYGQPSNRQIMVLYGAGHQVQYGEIAPLGGVDRAVPVSDETIDGLLARGMSLPDNHVFRAAGQADVYLSGGGQWHHVGSPGQRDCLLFGNSAVEEIVPASFIARLPQESPATCRLGDGAWLYDTSTNQQYLTVFGSAFQVQYGELVPLGGVDKAKPISHEGADYLERLDFTIPDNEMIKGFGPGVYQVKAGKLQAVGNPAIRDCLTAETGKQVRQVPEEVITRMKALGRVGPDARCALEGKQLLGPNGTSVAWIKDGYRRPVPNPAIRDCIAVRAGAGAPLRADEGVWNSYPAGPNAYCPYPASIRFVRGDGQAAAWRVYPDGTRQLLNAYCHDVDPANANDPRYKVYVVPAGEVDGHAVRQPNIFNATVVSCRAIP